MHVLEIVRELSATNSRLEKEAILERNKDNQEFKTWLHACLEPRLNFYIKKIPDYVAGVNSFNSITETITLLTNVLSTRSITGNAAIQYLVTLLTRLNPDDAKLIECCINKNPGCNVSTSTANKIFGDQFITDVPYMRCSLLKDVDIDSIPWEDGVYSELKADGLYSAASFDGNNINIESRNGTPFPIDQFVPLVTSIRTLAEHSDYGPFQLQGEMLVQDEKGNLFSRKESNGIMNSLIQGGELPNPECRVVYQVWDIIPLSEAKAKNKYKVPRKKRLADLEKFVGTDDENISVIEYEIVYSYAEAVEHFKKIRRRGLEGTVIKRPDAFWEDTTSRGQIKMKGEFQCELKVTGFNPAAKTSKNIDTFGSLLAESEDGNLEVSIPGFTDEMRQEIWNNRDKMIGTIISVVGCEVMKPGKTNKKHSIFLPRFDGIRTDKMVADDLETILKIQESALE